MVFQQERLNSWSSFAFLLFSSISWGSSQADLILLVLLMCWPVRVNATTAYLAILALISVAISILISLSFGYYSSMFLYPIRWVVIILYGPRFFKRLNLRVVRYVLFIHFAVSILQFINFDIRDYFEHSNIYGIDSGVTLVKYRVPGLSAGPATNSITAVLLLFLSHLKRNNTAVDLFMAVVICLISARTGLFLALFYMLFFSRKSIVVLSPLVIFTFLSHEYSEPIISRLMNFDKTIYDINEQSKISSFDVSFFGYFEPRSLAYSKGILDNGFFQYVYFFGVPFTFFMLTDYFWSIKNNLVFVLLLLFVSFKSMYLMSSVTIWLLYILRTNLTRTSVCGNN